MSARPDLSGHEGDPVYHGLGVQVRVVSGGLNIWHFGSQPGVEALALRNADGTGWVVAFNMRPMDSAGFRKDYDRALQNARASVQRWPVGDLFDRFKSPG